MVQVPASWRGTVARLAGSGQQTGIAARRILVPAPELYTYPVTVDLGNDGVAPQATFTGAGTAQAVIGPSSGGDLWSLDQCYLSTSIGQLDGAQVTVYAGPGPVAQYAVTGSLSGGSTQFGMGGIAVPFGWFIWALWTGGTAGAFGYLRVTGAKTVLTNTL